MYKNHQGGSLFQSEVIAIMEVDKVLCCALKSGQDLQNLLQWKLMLFQRNNNVYKHIIAVYFRTKSASSEENIAQNWKTFYCRTYKWGCDTVLDIP